MGLLKKADKNKSEVIFLEDDETIEDRDWIKVRTSLSKSEVNDILVQAPTGERDLRGGFQFLEEFFEAVVIDWSYVDEEGAPVKPEVKEYREMESEGASIIERKLGEHLNKIVGREVEKKEGESSS